MKEDTIDYTFTPKNPEQKDPQTDSSKSKEDPKTQVKSEQQTDAQNKSTPIKDEHMSESFEFSSKLDIDNKLKREPTKVPWRLEEKWQFNNLRQEHGDDYETIANILGKSVRQVKERVRSIREMLRLKVK